MHQIDPRNVESLFGMWTVFNKCSKSIKDGSRLENMSWRVWARETLCCPPQPERAIVPTLDAPSGRQSEVPSLSNSVASSDSGSDDESTADTSHPTTRTTFTEDDDSALSKSRGKEPHLTPSALEKIVVTIHEKAALGPLSPSIEASLPLLKSPELAPTPQPKEKPEEQEEEEQQEDKQMHNSTDSCISGATISTVVTNTTRISDHRNSDTSVSSDGLIRSGSVVHGFSPVSTSFRAKALQGLPVPMNKAAPKTLSKPGMFQLGASSEDDESSFEAKVQSFRPPQQRSSLSQSLSRQQLGLDKKKTSYRDIVEQRRNQSHAENDEGAIASSDEDDDESAIEDDEDEEADWEDSHSDDEKTSAPQNHTFRRVDSRPELVSRPSMLSMALGQKRGGGMTSALQNEASRSQPAFRRSRTSTPNGPSMPGSPEEHDEDVGLMMQGSKSRPRPIMMSASNPQQGMAHSPRTTRRNMLSTELTESLRKNLLWERQQKSQTANAFLRRSRNAQSMANLPAAASQPGPQEERSNNSWNDELEAPWEFNATGW